MCLPQSSLDIGNVTKDTINVTRLCTDIYRPDAWLQHLKMRNDKMPVVASQLAGSFSPIQPNNPPAVLPRQDRYHDEPRSIGIETVFNITLQA